MDTEQGLTSTFEVTSDCNSSSSVEHSKTESISQQKLCVVHSVLLLAQIIFASGSVIAALGLPSLNPVLFALIRECVAGPILCCIAYCTDKELPSIKDLFWSKLFLLPGFFLFCNQCFFIIGIKLSSSVTASAWQPSQAILAIIFGLCLGTENNTTIDIYKIFGILSAFIGALFMILFQNNGNSINNNNNDDKNSNSINLFVGHVCFFINCSSTALYIIFAKKTMKIYASQTVAGYSYIIAAFFMTIAAIIVSSSKT